MAETQESNLAKPDSGVESENANPAIPISLDSLLSVAGKWAALAGVLIGLTYVIGYVIVNLYLGVLGIRPPNFVASRYLATGLIYLFITAVPLLIIAVGFWSPGPAPITWRTWRRVVTRGGRAVICAVIAIAFILAIASLLTGADPSREINGKQPWEYLVTVIEFVINTALWLTSLTFIGPAFRGRIEKPNWWSWEWYYNLAGSIFWIPTVFALTCALFAGFAYPRIRPGFGGGASTPVQLIIDSHSDLTTVLPMSSRVRMTDTVALVDQTDDGYIIWLTATQQIVAVPHDAVHAVLVVPAIAKPSPLLLP